MDIERTIQDKGLTTAPRITPQAVEAAITDEYYFTAAQGVDMAYPEMTDAAMPAKLKVITICVLTMRNGHTITGVSNGPVSTRNFDAELGRSLARKAAVDRIWPLLGYALSQTLYERAVGSPVDNPRP